MRILHVLDHGLPLQSGYPFRTRAILKAQEGLGWPVAAVTGPRDDVAPASVELVDVLTFHRTAAGVRPGPVGEVVGIAAFAKRIEAAVDAFKPHILHVHSPVIAALAALIVARKRKLPLVYEVRAFWEDAAVGNGMGTATSMRYRIRRLSAITGWPTSSPIRANACV
jgi:glycogen(starch) synthase